MNGEQRMRRIVLGGLAAVLAVLVVTGGTPGASAVDKTRYPGYQGPDLEANCDALDEWEIDTAMYPECGPGGDENSEECNAQNVEGCVFDPLPGRQVADGRLDGNVAPGSEATLDASARDGGQIAAPEADQAPDKEKANGKGKGKGKGGKGKGGRRR